MTAKERLGDGLIIGAEPLAEEIYGDKRAKQRVYRLKGWPIFRLGTKLAARRSELRKRMELLEQAAIEGNHPTAKKRRKAPASNVAEASLAE